MVILDTHLTTGQLRQKLRADFDRDIPLWKLREVIDGLALTVPRVARARMLPKDLLPSVVRRLREQGWLPAGSMDKEAVA